MASVVAMGRDDAWRGLLRGVRIKHGKRERDRERQSEIGGTMCFGEGCGVLLRRGRMKHSKGC